MIRHTTLNLDMDLVEEARRVLKTKQVTETVHRALREVVSAQKRASLARQRLDLTPTSLRSMRRARTRRLSERFPAAR
jgi:Arc/MetJ family transcription regulator